VDPVETRLFLGEGRGAHFESNCDRAAFTRTVVWGSSLPLGRSAPVLPWTANQVTIFVFVAEKNEKGTIARNAG